jgi:hypothetical protein
VTLRGCAHGGGLRVSGALHRFSLRVGGFLDHLRLVRGGFFHGLLEGLGFWLVVFVHYG